MFSQYYISWDANTDSSSIPQVRVLIFWTLSWSNLSECWKEWGKQWNDHRRWMHHLAYEIQEKWCEFHQDYGHWTDKCHALRLEVTELVKQGHLKDFLTEQGRATRDESSNEYKEEIPPILPRHDKVINVISGGSKVSRVSYAATKRSSCLISQMNLHKSKTHDPEALQIIKFW